MVAEVGPQRGARSGRQFPLQPLQPAVQHLQLADVVGQLAGHALLHAAALQPVQRLGASRVGRMLLDRQQVQEQRPVRMIAPVLAQQLGRCLAQSITVGDVPLVALHVVVLGEIAQRQHPVEAQALVGPRGAVEALHRRHQHQAVVAVGLEALHQVALHLRRHAVEHRGAASAEIRRHQAGQQRELRQPGLAAEGVHAQQARSPVLRVAPEHAQWRQARAVQAVERRVQRRFVQPDHHVRADLRRRRQRRHARGRRLEGRGVAGGQGLGELEDAVGIDQA